MTIIEKQNALDEEKWLKSETLGRDACGEFEYCKFCDKGAEYPCATAHNLYEVAMNEKAKATLEKVKKVASKASKTTKKSTTKSSSKKTTTKKSTAKKTTKK